MFKNTKLKVLAIFAVLALAAIVLAGCGNTTASSSSAADNGDLAKKVDSLQKLMDVQQKSVNPGLGTVMIEYGQRMGKLWYSAQAKNWDMVRYQIDEMKEIQETGEITRPARADALKAFEGKYLDTIDKAAQAKDAAQFETAYKAAIDGCNSCHKSAKGKAGDGTEIPTYGFIKVQIPTGDPTNGFQDYKGN